MSTDFWTRSSRYGLVHKTAVPPANPEALVVFVLGVFGNCRRTWEYASEPVKKSSAGDRQAVVNMRSLSHEQRAFAVS